MRVKSRGQLIDIAALCCLYTDVRDFASGPVGYQFKYNPEDHAERWKNVDTVKKCLTAPPHNEQIGENGPEKSSGSTPLTL